MKRKVYITNADDGNKYEVIVYNEIGLKVFQIKVDEFITELHPTGVSNLPPKNKSTTHEYCPTCGSKSFDNCPECEDFL